VADAAAEAKIHDLERRLDMDPGSRLFVSLAEEYRKLGRLRQALSALQKGLLAHPGYVAAQVSLGRVYLEAGQSTDAIATFTKVLVADPGNLVAAKSLADVQLARGDKLEALKKYKLYRALSGDRKVDGMIAELETQVAPRPVPPPRTKAPAEPLPPPPSFQETDKSRRRAMPKPVLRSEPSGLSEPFEVTSVTFDPGEDSGKARASEGPFLIPTRDVALAPAPPPAPGEPEPAPVEASEAPAPVEAPAAVPAVPAEPEETSKPTGRALADLYYSQGHYAEALQIYDDLVNRHPFDEELQRMRRDAEARLLPAGSPPASGPPAATPPDNALERRQARIRALKQWLSAVQAG
jgi:tetratricopeptide (TPR) repeat protein